MPELHGRCRTVCPNNRKLNSNLISPLNFLNRTNGSQIRAFLSVTSEPSVGGGGAPSRGKFFETNYFFRYFP